MPNLMDEVEECLGMGYKEFHFYDDLFNITPKKVMDFCDEIEKRKLKFIWDFRGRVDSVTRESLERARRAGCRLISFGVETGTNAGLKFMEKGTTIEKVEQVFKWCRELGIRTVADYMIGLPFERTREDVLKNIDFLIKLDPDYAQIGILCLYPNTKAYDMAVEKKLADYQKWVDFSLSPEKNFKIDHWNEFLDDKTLLDLKKTAYKKYYLRMKYIMRQIFDTRSVYELRSKIRGAMTIFFR